MRQPSITNNPERYHQALETFRRSAYDILRYSNSGLLMDGFANYPFDRPFDEVLLRIQQWVADQVPRYTHLRSNAN